MELKNATRLHVLEGLLESERHATADDELVDLHRWSAGHACLEM
jgi:hypothetical protein